MQIRDEPLEGEHFAVDVLISVQDASLYFFFCDCQAILPFLVLILHVAMHDLEETEMNEEPLVSRSLPFLSIVTQYILEHGADILESVARSQTILIQLKPVPQQSDIRIIFLLSLLVLLTVDIKHPSNFNGIFCNLWLAMIRCFFDSRLLLELLSIFQGRGESRLRWIVAGSSRFLDCR